MLRAPPAPARMAPRAGCCPDELLPTSRCPLARLAVGPLAPEICRFPASADCARVPLGGSFQKPAAQTAPAAGSARPPQTCVGVFLSGLSQDCSGLAPGCPAVPPGTALPPGSDAAAVYKNHCARVTPASPPNSTQLMPLPAFLSESRRMSLSPITQPYSASTLLIRNYPQRSASHPGNESRAFFCSCRPSRSVRRAGGSIMPGYAGFSSRRGHHAPQKKRKRSGGRDCRASLLPGVIVN